MTFGSQLYKYNYVIELFIVEIMFQKEHTTQ